MLSRLCVVKRFRFFEGGVGGRQEQTNSETIHLRRNKFREGRKGLSSPCARERERERERRQKERTLTAESVPSSFRRYRERESSSHFHLLSSAGGIRFCRVSSPSLGIIDVLIDLIRPLKKFDGPHFAAAAPSPSLVHAFKRF